MYFNIVSMGKIWEKHWIKQVIGLVVFELTLSDPYVESKNSYVCEF